MYEVIVRVDNKKIHKLAPCRHAYTAIQKDDEYICTTCYKKCKLYDLNDMCKAFKKEK